MSAVTFMYAVVINPDYMNSELNLEYKMLRFCLGQDGSLLHTQISFPI